MQDEFAQPRFIRNQKENNWTYNMQEEIAQPIRELSSKLTTFADMDEAITILRQFKKSVENVQTDLYNGIDQYLNYYIFPRLGMGDTTSNSNLRFINRHGYCRTSAPELVHYGVSQDNAFSVTIYKLNDTKGGKLLPLGLLKDIGAEQKAKFLEEQIRLLEDTGLYNHAVVDSWDYWLLTPDTRNIFIGVWDDLSECESPEEKEKIKAMLKECLIWKGR